MIKLIRLSIIIIILTSAITLLMPYGKDYVTHYQEEKIIAKQFNPQKVIATNVQTNDYLGVIKFPKYNFQKLILKGDIDKVLAQNYIAMINKSSLDNDPNVVLGGHNKNKVFHILEEIELNDIIILTTKKDTYYFQVSDKYKVLNNVKMSYKNILPKRLLTLITCIDNNKNRLVIEAVLKK